MSTPIAKGTRCRRAVLQQRPKASPPSLGRISTPATCRSLRRAAWATIPAKLASPSSVHRQRAILAMAFAEPACLQRRLWIPRSEEHTSELQSRLHLVCRLLLEKKKNDTRNCRPKSKQFYLPPWV